MIENANTKVQLAIHFKNGIMKYVKVSAKIMVRTKDFIVLYQMYL